MVTRPTARAGHALAYDSESDRVILFGGRVPGLVSNDETWTYDVASNHWTRMNPATRPPARFGHAMVYVPGIDRILLFGGASAIGSNLDDTWEYDANSDLWTRILPSASPSPRANHAIAYDEPSGAVVLFGGNRAGTFNDETWAYNPQTSAWTKMNPVTAPSPRERHRMVYVSASDKIVLFGGNDPVGVLNGETWTYDLNVDRWTKMNPATAPSSRHGHHMAYDVAADRVILFSGDSGATDDQTWAYDLGTNSWEQRSPAVAPGGRVLHSMAYDIESDRTILFGGEWPFLSESYNNETWVYDFDANEWLHVDAAMRPSPRAYHAMAYDSESDRIVLFGGSTRGAVSSAETWAYDANTNIWRIRSPSPSPSSRDAHAMAYDAGSDRVILFGGFTASGPNNETWAYDYNSNTWTNMMPTVGPSRRYATRMVYDSLMDRIILFGGEDGVGFLGDTWSYDYNSNTWTRLTTVGTSPARGFYAMGYDAESDLVIVFGGNGAPIRGDTWTFRTGTTTWTQVTPAQRPSPRGWCSGTYDEGLDRFLIFGGDAGSTETWAFDANANSWSRVDTGPGPSERHEHAMVYDGQSNRVVLFGGAWPVLLVTDPNMVRNRETWSFDSGNRSWTMVDGPEPPTARFTFSPATPVAGETVTFDASVSTDPDGAITSGAWTFGDGGSSTGIAVTHVYSAAGTYTATLTVQDDDGLTNVTSRPLVIAPGEPDTIPPTVTITSPADGATIASTSVTVSGTASDNVAISKVELSLDGTTWVSATGTTSWSGTLTPKEGSNTITARATDASGNAATTSVTVTVRPPPPPPPPLLLIGLAAAVVAAGGVVAAVLIQRRRKRG